MFINFIFLRFSHLFHLLFFHQSCETITAGLNESKQEEEEDYIGILAEQQTTQI